jgi:hypothetical protein
MKKYENDVSAHRCAGLIPQQHQIAVLTGLSALRGQMLFAVPGQRPLRRYRSLAWRSCPRARSGPADRDLPLDDAATSRQQTDRRVDR